MRCERCDRPKAALKSNDYDPAFCWTVDIGTDMPLNWRRFKPSPLDDCRAHAVDWRSEALSLRVAAAANLEKLGRLQQWAIDTFNGAELYSEPKAQAMRTASNRVTGILDAPDAAKDAK